MKEGKIRLEWSVWKSFASGYVQTPLRMVHYSCPIVAFLVNFVRRRPHRIIWWKRQLFKLGSIPNLINTDRLFNCVRGREKQNVKIGSDQWCWLTKRGHFKEPTSQHERTNWRRSYEFFKGISRDDFIIFSSLKRDDVTSKTKQKQQKKKHTKTAKNKNQPTKQAN